MRFTFVWFVGFMVLACLFTGVAAANSVPVVRLITESGPWIEVDGERHPPLMLFVNSELPPRDIMDNVRDQLLYAREAGIPFISIPAQFPWESRGYRDFSHLQLWFDFVLSIYPEAYIIPRIRLDPPMDYWSGVFPDDLIRYADGSTSLFSLGSDAWRHMARDALAAGIDFVETHPRYGSQVVGYHLAYGGTNEWFHFWYREKGNDISDLNVRTFRAWLLDKYGSVDAISQAWDRHEFDLEDVTIRSDPRTYSTQPFLNPKKDREMVDFFEFTNDIVADRLLEMAAHVKQLTNDERLVVAFYGYHFELPDSHSGHLSLRRVLKSRDIDILASPFSYYMRDVGEIGGFMGPVDSMLLNNKIWVMEDDTRTFLATHSDRDGGYNVYIETLEDSIAVHMRNLGSLITRGGGVWWMDLWSSGWLNDPDLWKNIEAMKDVYIDYRERAETYRPDIAFIVDEESFRYTTQARAVYDLLLFRQRESIYKSGVSFGLYLLDDVLEGGLSGTDTYVFLNLHHVTDEERLGIEQLKSDGNTLVWVYGADFITDGKIGDITGFEIERVQSRLAGGRLSRIPEVSEPWAENIGDVFGRDLRGAPVYRIVEREGVQPIARYVGDDAAIGFAVEQHDDWTSVFYGSWMLEPQVIRALAALAGKHVYVQSADTVHTDGRFFSIHAATSGSKQIDFPYPGDVIDPFSRIVLQTEVESIEFDMKEGETRWLEFVPVQ